MEKKMEEDSIEVVEDSIVVLEEDSISVFDYFENLIATRLFKYRQKSSDFLAEYSKMMIESIIKHPELEEELLCKLDNYIVRIIKDCEVFFPMNNNEIIDTISELSNYATIFVKNEKYTDRYELVCRRIRDIQEHNPCPEMDWVESEKGYTDIE